MQVSPLQLMIPCKSSAPAKMIIFVSTLVDMLVWPEPSARMIDASSFLEQQNSPACFVSASALESQRSCCQERQRAVGAVDIFWPTWETYPSHSSACKSSRQEQVWLSRTHILTLPWPFPTGLLSLGWLCSALPLLRSHDIALSSIMTKPADWPMNNCHIFELYCWVYDWVRLCPYDSIKTEVTAMYFDLLGC